MNNNNNKIINLYDESIFSLPLPKNSILNSFTLFHVSNKVDDWLLREKHNRGRQIIDNATTTTITSRDKILYINPETPRPGINLFTIDSTNVDKVIDLQTYIQIQVEYDNELSSQMLELADFFRYDSHKTLTINSHAALTSLESALLVKFYAIRYKEVIIDRQLYSFICGRFVDNRAWFRLRSDEKQQQQQQLTPTIENIHFKNTNRVFGLY